MSTSEYPIEIFLDAVCRDDMEKMMEVLWEVDGLDGMLNQAQTVSRQKLNSFVTYCWLKATTEDGRNFIKGVFDCGSSTDDFLWWLVGKGHTDVIPLATFLVKIGRAKDATMIRPFMAPFELLDDSDHRDLELARAVSQQMGIELDEPDRLDVSSLMDRVVTFKLDSQQKRKRDDPKFKMSLEDIRGVKYLAGNYADSKEMTVTLTGTYEFDKKLVVALQDRFPRTYVTHKPCSQCRAFPGYPYMERDPTSGGRNLVVITIHKTNQPTCATGEIH